MARAKASNFYPLNQAPKYVDIIFCDEGGTVFTGFIGNLGEIVPETDHLVINADEDAMGGIEPGFSNNEIIGWYPLPHIDFYD